MARASAAARGRCTTPTIALARRSPTAARRSALDVAGWGADDHRQVRERAQHVLALLRRPPNAIAIESLGLTKAGAPLHPSRVRTAAHRRPLETRVARGDIAA